MGSPAEKTRTTGRIIPVMLTLLVLGIFLSIYFLKYIPQQRSAYNNRAFLELEQIAKAVQGRTTGYSKALSVYVGQPNTNSPVLQSLKFSPHGLNDHELKDSLYVGLDTLTLDSAAGNEWQITFPLYPLGAKNAPRYDQQTYSASIRFDTLLQPIIVTYRNLFENYLMIRRPDFKSENNKNRRGGILFNSGDLPLGNVFDMDSLLKKSDGLSLLYIHDLNIEGIPYKLFLYPFQLGKEQIYLAGLISTNGYNAIYKSIPLDLFAPATILILILLINLPILKIFILNAAERISDWDIRLIIGSYFVAAFTAFFLFSWLFLTRIQAADSENSLMTLSGRIQDELAAEIKSICLQMQKWDEKYAKLIDDRIPKMTYGQSQQLLQELEGKHISLHADSIELDNLLRPNIYPYAKYAFWIDSAGKWIASWSAKTNNGNLPRLSVGDRPYFRNYVDHNYLRLPGTCPFTIEPTWSRLDGGYTVSIVTESIASQEAWKKLPAGNKPPVPFLIGLSADLYSVTNPIIPPGYNFSIVDQSGKVLYDSKPGRALQADILKESADPSAILECIHFRNTRFFDEFRLNGQPVSMIASPIKGLPYTLLTYHDRSGADDFQLHLISLSAFFTTCVLFLLILSTAINAWTGIKPQLLLTPPKHFEWLRPLPRKKGYYLYLIKGMAGMLCVFIASWILIPLIWPEEEFSLFFISLVFPFYIAIYYYRLREIEKCNSLRSILPVLVFLILAIVIIQSFSFEGGSSSGWILIVVQTLFLLTMHLFLKNFPAGTTKDKIDWTEDGPLLTIDPHALSNPSSAPKSSTPASKNAGWLTCYAAAIVFGVFMISIVPACAVFWLFFRQESGLQNNNSRLEIARNINERRIVINKEMAKYKSGPGRDDSSIRQLKFRHGIYFFLDDTIFRNQAASTHPFAPVAPQYAGIHRLFFPLDSNILSSTTGTGAVEDGSWNFLRSTEKNGEIRLTDRLPPDGTDTDTLQLIIRPEASYTATGLMLRKAWTTGALFLFLYFGSQLLCLFFAWIITRTLAERIFLVDLFKGLPYTAGPPAEPAAAGSIANSATPGPAPKTPPKTLDFRTIRKDEQKPTHPSEWAATILTNLGTYEEEYTQKWIILSAEEKYTLYDLAKDGFANYKTGALLHQLLKKDLLAFRNGQPELITASFREFVLQQSDDPGVVACWKKSIQKGQWQAFKTPLIILFSAFGIFLFVTQDDLFQKLTGLFTALISLSTKFSSVFDRIAPKSPDNTSEDNG